MSDAMRAVVVGEDKGLRVCEVPKPRAGKGELLLRVSACGICGSDLHAVDFGMVGPGTVLGHEFAGEVAEIGEGVADEWHIGDRANGVGADVLIDANEDSDPVAAFHAKTGVTPKVIFECTGAPGIVSSLVAAAPHECHLVLAGTGMHEESIRVADAAMKKLRMSFSMGYPPELFPRVLFLLEQGRVSTTDMVTDTVKLEEVPEIFEELKRPNEHGKIIIKP